uniref:Uncharacterized protein n=1 Tax=Pyrodinium bahamense TaxID=73915 RepID=A0A7R9ZWT4_9DINO|mmetsp:Transcript_12876/g.35646  ORF Transcript_12876/g.35646 Transcript_12876/m.35646 type:complete len:153 (+) Transcript_12876:85-543(+)
MFAPLHAAVLALAVCPPAKVAGMALSRSSGRSPLAAVFRSTSSTNPTIALIESSREAADVLRPNGPLLMNLTRMGTGDLPVRSQHVNSYTVTSDWLEEYPVVAAPSPLAAPAAARQAPPPEGPGAVSRRGPELAAAALLGAASVLTVLHWCQ